jgi:hypothetical protein
MGISAFSKWIRLVWARGLSMIFSVLYAKLTKPRDSASLMFFQSAMQAGGEPV